MHGSKIGIERAYHSDNWKCIVSDKKNETATSGWMHFVTEHCRKIKHPLKKRLYKDGSIEEGHRDRHDNLRDGYRWELQDDGSHNKYKVED